MKDVRPPSSKAELQAALRQQTEAFGTYLAEMPAAELFAPQGEFWSPAGHLEHLVKCIRPLARAMGLPKPALLLRFGPNLRPARAFEEIRDRYRGALAAGGRASGPYVPSQQAPDAWTEEGRRDLFEQWRRVNLALDRLRLPHPLIGKLSVREILLWTFYHNHHHQQRVEERRSLYDAEGPELAASTSG